MGSNNKKTELLGENISNAQHKLRKLVLFTLIKQLELDSCHQCSDKIEDIDTFSIEHKDPWMQSENPKEAFYDVNNIAFSHLSCNSGAAVRLPRLSEEERTASKERRKARDKELAQSPSRKQYEYDYNRRPDRMEYQRQRYHARLAQR